MLNAFVSVADVTAVLSLTAGGLFLGFAAVLGLLAVSRRMDVGVPGLFASVIAVQTAAGLWFLLQAFSPNETVHWLALPSLCVTTAAGMIALVLLCVHWRYLLSLPPLWQAQELFKHQLELNAARGESGRARQQLVDFIDNCPALVFIKDVTNFRYLLVNHAWADVGSNPADVIGKSDFELFHKAQAQTLRDHDQQVLRAGCPSRFEESVTFPVGQRQYLCTKFLITNGNGKPHALCGVAVDISNYKQTESLLQHNVVSLEGQVGKLESIVKGSDSGGIAEADKTIRDVADSLRMLADEQRVK